MRTARLPPRPLHPEKIFQLEKDAAVLFYLARLVYFVEPAEKVRPFNLPVIGFVLIAVINSRHEQ